MSSNLTRCQERIQVFVYIRVSQATSAKYSASGKGESLPAGDQSRPPRWQCRGSQCAVDTNKVTLPFPTFIFVCGGGVRALNFISIYEWNVRVLLT